MFKVGQDAFIISAIDLDRNGSIKIQKHKVINKVSNTKLRLDSNPPMIVNDWAIGGTPDEATKIGITFLINKIEFNKDINMFTINDYKKLEQEHSELLFKYMSKVVDDY